MENESKKNNNLRALFIILNAGFSEEVIESAREEGIIGATIIHARGAGEPKAFMGITVDSEKEIVFSITTESIAKNVMNKIKERHGISTPSRCVCFLMPVESTAGISLSQAERQP